MTFRKGMLCFMIAMLGAGAATAAPEHFVDLHFLHPLATSPDPQTDSTVRLSLLWARSGSVKALDLGLVATGTSGDVKGLQWSTYYAGVGGDLRGVGASLGLHRVGGDVRGAQFGLVADWTAGAVSGVQFGGLYGYAGRGLRGAQLSGLMNANDGDGRWVQLAGAVNVNVGDFTGAQVSGFVNHVNRELSGAQLGALNFADTGRGLQVGVVNLARDFSGFRMGVVNAADTMDGLPLGLVNLTEDNPRHWLFYATNVMALNVGFRTEVNGWVSTVVLGGHEIDAVREEAGSVGWHFGRRLWGDARRSVTADLGFQHVMPNIPDDLAGTGITNHPLVQLRLTADWVVGDHVSIHGVLGVNSTGASYEDGAESESKGLAGLGVALR